MSSQPKDTSLHALRLLARRSNMFALIGFAAGLFFPLIAAVMKVNELHLPVSLATVLAVQSLEPVLWVTDTAPFILAIVAGAIGRRQEMMLDANARLTEREAEMVRVRNSLEASVNERTRQLDARNAEMRSVVTFARQVADIQDLPALLSASVEILHERFPQYDVNLFLLDEQRQTAVLRASSSAGGKGMVQSGHRVPLGDQSTIARVARRGKMLLSTARPEPSDKAAQHAPAQALVNQVALPLVVHGKVTGVLDMLPQPAQPVGQAEADVLQLLADQLAGSIETARLATQSRTTVAELEAVSAERTRGTWQKYLSGAALAYQFTPSGVRAVAPDVTTGGLDAVRIPIILRGQQIGSIAIRRKSGAAWSPNEQDLLEKVAAQVGLALDNVRLLEETRQRAAQEQIISEISARFSRSLDVDALLQAAVREFAALPDVAEATVLLKPTEGQGLQSPR